MTRAKANWLAPHQFEKLSIPSLTDDLGEDRAVVSAEPLLQKWMIGTPSSKLLDWGPCWQRAKDWLRCCV